MRSINLQVNQWNRHRRIAYNSKVQIHVVRMNQIIGKIEKEGEGGNREREREGFFFFFFFFFL